MKVGWVGVVPAEVPLVNSLDVMHEVAVVTTSMTVLKKIFWQREHLGNFRSYVAVVCKAHCLIMHPAIQVALQCEEVNNVGVSPSWPMVRSKHQRSVCAKEFNAFIDVLRPAERIAYLSTTNRHKIVHGMCAIFCHAQPSMVRKEEIHFSRCFSVWRELENNAYAIDNKFFTCICDVFGRRNEP